MDKQTERKILDTMFESGLSEKISLPPKWYPYVLFFMIGCIITSIYDFFTGRWFFGLIFIAIAVAIYVLSYFYRSKAILKAVRKMPKEEINEFLPRTTFTTCRKCKNQTSKVGNYTNMFLSGICNPGEFDNHYGMMCANHAAEITQKIIKEKNLTELDLENAHKKALKIMDEEISNL